MVQRIFQPPNLFNTLGAAACKKELSYFVPKNLQKGTTLKCQWPAGLTPSYLLQRFAKFLENLGRYSQNCLRFFWIRGALTDIRQVDY